MVQVDWECSKCNKANIEYTGVENHNAKYMQYFKHRCPACKKIMWTMHIFPYLEHVYAVPRDVKKALRIKNQ